MTSGHVTAGHFIIDIFVSLFLENALYGTAACRISHSDFVGFIALFPQSKVEPNFDRL